MLDNNFLFGTATSAYQIEGAWNEDGKALSIWDEISHGNQHSPNGNLWKVRDGHTGDIAADHYHQWQDDVQLMKHLGINAYRFSISWSRICTKKAACTNLKGVEFYQNLVKALKEEGIEPFVTLYHWDLPKWLDDVGGWRNPKSIDYFRMYAETMFNALPDVKYWITFNEPAVFVNNYWGHDNLAKAIMNVLISHREVAYGYRHEHDGKLGISLNLMPISPNEYGNKQDELAVENIDKRHNRLWLDPIFKGEFPKDINKLFSFKGKNKLKSEPIWETPTDFLGINYYTGVTVKYNKYNPPTYAEQMPNSLKKDETGVTTYPYGLYVLLKDLKEKYDNPEMYVTENGCACPDTFTHDKKIHDPYRIDYIREHLYYCDYARQEGVNLKGYFYWSFMDNFEWLQGYTKRFGLMYIFYPTQSRVPKDSFHWYQKIIKDKKFREKEIKLKKR